MSQMLDSAALRALSAEERQRLLRDLIDIERASEPKPGTDWKRDLLLVAIAAGCLLLAAWTAYLGVTLPRFYRTGSWRGAWVGFDIALLAAFVVTGWAAWRRRQVLIISLIVLATLLICDAWFDVVLDHRTRGFYESLASALLVELPLAVVATGMARRLLHQTIAQAMRYEGLTGPVPPLWRIPLLGPADGTPLRRLLDARASIKAAAGPSRAPSSGGRRSR
jgi:hypothetical protein